MIVKRSVVENAGKALDELEAYDKLLAAKEAELKAVSDRLETEKQKSQLLAELAASRSNEANAIISANKSLTEALNAKNEALNAKDKEISILKKKKPSFLKTIQLVAAGVGLALILK